MSNGPMIIVRGGQREAIERWRQASMLDEATADLILEEATDIVRQLRERQAPPMLGALIGYAVAQLSCAGGGMPTHDSRRLANDQLPLLWEIAMRVSDAAGAADEAPDPGGAVERVAH